MKKKKIKKLTTVAAPVLAVSMALAACSGSGDKEKANTTPKSDEKSGGKLAAKQVLNLTEPQEIPSMDSSKATDQVSFLVMNNVMEGLYRLGKDNKVTPGVAESYKKSDDGKKYTFTLNKNAKWSNGDPVTAKDFVFAWKRALDPNTAAEYAYIMYDLKNAKAINEGKAPLDTLGVKAVDDYTLEVELENPIPYFVELTSFGTFYPLNEKFVKEKGDKFGLEADTTLYNGPFTLSEWQHEEGWKLKKNEQYWDNKTVKLEEINFNVVKETGTRVNLYESGQIDRAEISSEFVDKYKSSPDFLTEETSSVFFLRLNQKRGGKDTVFTNKDLRLAIAMAYDKKGLTNVILNDGSKPADYFVPKEFAKGPDGKDFRKENGNILKTDVKKAKEHWEKAKKELGKDAITVELLNYDTESSKKIGEYLKGELEKNLPGLTVNLKNQPFKQKLKLETDQNYELSFAGWGPDYLDPMTFIDMFITNGAHNQSGYSNSKYDKLVEQGKGELLTKTKERWDGLLKAEKMLLEDAAIAPLFQEGKGIIQKQKVKGIVRHPVGGDYSYKWAYISDDK
ncbi:peptide ABC transporter substrate-binding protein [Bacillus cytotoxicus]|uniref:peptide ABC transporter substrate-binding protein n=1 Tax=Bacillus cereus group TaxID=86661 RepID=UPI001AEE7A4E|nr:MULTISPECIES: peptide ABC transporter substrate-binding protein [Bacillus cereus group]MDH2881999.1 peptide ABC transporter substrate-binding protein [Bacillus cytotoxicus]QTR81769.1 peptide ABC transporter substrate-binding protein [Bacillus cytotoxicus]QTR85505.1 peptide ABC transporter substrate-binding protein [Bacillus cytotoxicus]HDR4572981.1 peptide ABC transporter substrate-binding protein [Bacillus cytotoxicus]HDR4588965.1 peptide ABC transporter substrate-binding protein [Bacillus